MKKVFYIHPGVHKTGSTAIQHALEENQAVLNEMGFASLVPHEGLIPVHQLFNPKAYGLTDAPDIEVTRKLLADQLEQIPQRNIIFSEEDFTALYWPWRRHAILLKELIEPFADAVHLIFYVRRQDKLYESAYLQRLAGGSFTGSIERLMENPQTSPYENNLNWCDKIMEYRDIIEPDSLRIQIYDVLRRQGTDIFYDFCSQLGITQLERLKPSKRVNTSQPLWVSKAQSSLRWIPGKFTGRLLNRLNHFRALFPSGATPSNLDEAQAQEIMRFYADTNLRLVKQYAPDELEWLVQDWCLQSALSD